MFLRRVKRIDELDARGDVDGLATILSSGSIGERALAARALKNHSTGDVERNLLNALRDPSFIVRQSAAESLAEVNPNIDAEAVLAAIRDRPGASELTKPVTADEIVWGGLWPIKSLRAAETLIGSMNGASDVERDIYADVLGKIGDRRATPMLVELLNDPNEAVRQTAAESLEDLSDPAAIPSLIRALGDERRSIRRVASRALVAQGQMAHEPLNHIALSSASPRVRREAKKVLRRLASGRANRTRRT